MMLPRFESRSSVPAGGRVGFVYGSIQYTFVVGDVGDVGDVVVEALCCCCCCFLVLVVASHHMMVSNLLHGSGFLISNDGQ